MHDRPLANVLPETEPIEPGRGPLSREERAAAFAAGAPKIPGRTIVAIVCACLVLGLGGIVVDHFFSGPDRTTASEPPVGTDPPPLATVGGSASVGAPISAMMDLRTETASPAPPVNLYDEVGRPFRLSQLRGSVVVLSFFAARCDDICPVLATELRLSRADLGDAEEHVAFVTVNTDPLAVSRADAAPAEHVGLSQADRWYFLTGSLRQLDNVWRRYGVTIDVQPVTGQVSHNDALYFIDPAGDLRASAIPFADESDTGRFSLSSATEARWGLGIADEARSLLGRRS